MPIYEYECPSCGHRFEKLVRINADVPPCEKCESADVRKLVSASGFILKGGGWYKDHYGLKGGSSKSESPKSDSSKADGTTKSSTKSESAKSAPTKSSSSSSKGDA